MRNGQGKEVASASVMIKKYVKLDPDDEFNSQTLIKRHGEQLKNKHKPSKWCRLHITNDELWLSGAYWWPNSILNGIHLSEINCLVKFYSTPNLLAIGIASRLYESEKQYVILCTKSGSDREQLVKTLTTLCGNRYTQSEKRFNVPIVGPTVNIVEISLSPDLKKSVPVGKSIEINHEPSIHPISCNNPEPYIKETTIKIERHPSPNLISTAPISPDHITTNVTVPANNTTTVSTCTTTSNTTTNINYNNAIDNHDVHYNDCDTINALCTISPSQKIYQEIQLTSNDNMRPYRLKRFMAPYCEGLESGLNPKDLIHVYYDPKQGNIISPDGPIYLYCVNCPTE
uniref:IRS-type PTB domain-containing protein n=1 Tax=Schistosoma mansoni TaxID=6183 RepID=A0A3Q0KL08_SCHMA